MRRLLLLAPLLALSVVWAGEEPVPGPPWRTDFREARREALRTGRPVFLYFTKTY